MISFNKLGTITEEGSITNWKFDHDRCRLEFARMVILDEMPFRTVEKEVFRRLMAAAQPKFKFMSRPTLRKDCMEVYESEKFNLKGSLKNSFQRICLTTDLWTSIKMMGFICLTGHYIDKDWKLQKKILNFRSLQSPHTGDAIADAIETCLLEWGIDKLFTITMDNASSNDVVARNLVNSLSKKQSVLVLGGRHFHVHCGAHILNLIVQDGINEIKDSISHIRSSVRYVLASSGRRQQFQYYACQERIETKRGLSMDVCTRWNSTYLMLENALRYKEAFERLKTRDPNFLPVAPNPVDWEKGTKLCSFFKVFHNATLRFSSFNSPTSNLFFRDIIDIQYNLRVLTTGCYDEVREMVRKMQIKFDKYWKDLNPIFAIALILDPRYKLVALQCGYQQLYPNSDIEIMVNEVVKTMREIFKEYEENYGSTSSCLSEGRRSATTVLPSFDASWFEVNFDTIMQSNEVNDMKTELDQYMEEKNHPRHSQSGEAFEILQWWRVNTEKYPILSMMARDLLAIPVSTVASESTFSTGGRVLDQFRSSLTSNVVEALVCAQDWLRSSPPQGDEESDEELVDLV